MRKELKTLGLILMMLPLVAVAKGKEKGKKISLEVGSTYHYQLTEKLKSSQKLMGQSIRIKRSNELFWAYKVVSKDKKGRYTIQVSLQRVVGKTDNNILGKEKFDSQTEGGKPYSFIKMQHFLIGKSYQAVLEPNGKVKKLVGYKELYSKMAEMDFGKSEQAAAIKGASLARMKPEIVAAELAAVFGSAPSEDYSKQGNTWTKPKTKGQYLGEEVYTVTEIVDGKSTIAAVWNMKANPEAKAAQQGNGIYSKSKMDGTTTRTISYMLNSNLLLYSTYVQELDGFMEMYGGMLGDVPTDVPSTIANESSIQLLHID